MNIKIISDIKVLKVKVKVKGKGKFHSLDQVETSLSCIIGNGPILTNCAFWIMEVKRTHILQGYNFLSAPIKAGLSVAHVDPISKFHRNFGN